MDSILYSDIDFQALIRGSNFGDLAFSFLETTRGIAANNEVTGVLKTNFIWETTGRLTNHVILKGRRNYPNENINDLWWIVELRN